MNWNPKIGHFFKFSPLPCSSSGLEASIVCQMQFSYSLNLPLTTPPTWNARRRPSLWQSPTSALASPSPSDWPRNRSSTISPTGLTVPGFRSTSSMIIWGKPRDFLQWPSLFLALLLSSPFNFVVSIWSSILVLILIGSFIYIMRVWLFVWSCFDFYDWLFDLKESCCFWSISRTQPNYLMCVKINLVCFPGHESLKWLVRHVTFLCFQFF